MGSLGEMEKRENTMASRTEPGIRQQLEDRWTKLQKFEKAKLKG